MLLQKYLFLKMCCWIFIYKACSRTVFHTKRAVDLTLGIMFSYEDMKIKMKIEQVTAGSV